MSSYQSPSSYYLLNQVALSNSIRKLWVDYISWTTALIYTILFGTHDQASIEARLDQTADEYASLFGQFYGQEAANKLRTQLMEFSRGISGLTEAYRDEISALFRIGGKPCIIWRMKCRCCIRSSTAIGICRLCRSLCMK